MLAPAPADAPTRRSTSATSADGSSRSASGARWHVQRDTSRREVAGAWTTCASARRGRRGESPGSPRSSSLGRSREWMELPLWIAGPDSRTAIAWTSSVALAAGLSLRPLEETVQGALEDAETSDASVWRRTRSGAPRGVAWPRIRTTRGRRSRKKLGAKPGVERRRLLHDAARRARAALRGAEGDARPADGLWIAWPKKAAKLEGDLDFDAVQEIGLAARPRRQQELLDRRALAGAALRLPAHGSAA